MSKIEDMRRSMTEAGVYSKADIDEICRLESEYEKECSEMEKTTNCAVRPLVNTTTSKLQSSTRNTIAETNRKRRL